MSTTFTSRSMDITERLLDDAGVAPGMCVLDLGCGPGDVSLMIAPRVGPSGQVVGIDRNAEAIAAARDRFTKMKIEWARFVVGDLIEPSIKAGPFDAIVSRRVLMYLPDPAATLRRLMPLLKPGGRVIVQEHDATMLPGRLAPFPEHEKLLDLMWQTVVHEGADVHIGFKLPSIFAAAGLRLEHIHAEAIVRVAGLQPDAGTHDLVKLGGMMAARMEQHGVATAADIALDTLAERLALELANTGTPYIGDIAFCAWARKPRSQEP
jgi:SAM-dependent methyltransferase